MNYPKLGTDIRYNYYLILKSAFTPFKPQSLNSAIEWYKVESGDISYFSNIFQKLYTDSTHYNLPDIYRVIESDQSGYLMVWIERYLEEMAIKISEQFLQFNTYSHTIWALDNLFRALPQLKSKTSGILAYVIGVYNFYKSNYKAAYNLFYYAESYLQEYENQKHYASVLHFMGMNFRMLGQFEQALRYHEYALAEISSLNPPSPRLTASILDAFAITKRYTGFYSEAFELAERAVSIRTLQYGQNHHEMVDSLVVRLNINIYRGEFNLALNDANKILEILENAPHTYNAGVAFYEASIAYLYAYEHEKAEKLLAKSYEIIHNIFPEENYDVANIYHNQALIALKKTNFGESLAFENKALALFEFILPEIHPDLSAVYNSYALIKANTGSQDEAIEYVVKSAEIHRKLFSSSHPDFAFIYNNMASIYSTFSRMDEALKYYEEASKVYEKNEMTDHPHLSTYYSNLALLYQLKKDYEQSREFLLKAKRIVEERLGHEHPDMAHIHNNLSLVYHVLGRDDLSLKHLRKSIEIIEKVFGPNHYKLAQAYNNMAFNYQERNRFEEALTYSQRALDIFVSVMGEENAEVSNTYNTLSFIRRRMKEYDKSLKYSVKALELQILIAKNKPTNELAIFYNNTADSYLLVGELDKALEHSKKALTILKAVEKSGAELNQIYLGSIYNSLAINYVHRNEFKNAIKYLHLAEKAFEKNVDFSHSFLFTIYENLANLYSNSQINNLAKAIQYAKKLLQIRRKYAANYATELNAAMEKLAELYFRFEKYRLAAGLWLKVIPYKDDTDFEESKYIYNQIARCFYRIGEFEKAVEYYQIAFDRFTDSEELTDDYYYGFVENSIEISDAYIKLGLFKRAINIVPDLLEYMNEDYGKYPPEITYEYGGCIMADVGLHNRALEYFYKALDEIRNKDYYPEMLARIYYRLSHSYFAMGNKTKAIEYSNHAQEIIHLKIKKYSPMLYHILLWHKQLQLPNRLFS